jgi:cation transport ATPase
MAEASPRTKLFCHLANSCAKPVVILFLIVSALGEKINLTAGVIGHEASTVVVILNRLRLRPRKSS